VSPLVFENYQDKVGDWRWRIKVRSNGRTIADSAEGYRNKIDCQRGIELIQHYAPTTPITEEPKTILSARPIGLGRF
jgi:uncharacterized protein